MEDKHVNLNPSSISIQILCEKRDKNVRFDTESRKTCETYDSAAQRPEPPHQSQSQQEKEHQEHNGHHCTVRLMRGNIYN